MPSFDMNRRSFIGTLAASLSVFALGAGTAASNPARKPNILLFLVDDMGWQDTSLPFWRFKTLFNKHFRTPNMERLAKQGVKFTHAHSHPVCSPTRTSIMTGWHPARHHVTNWTFSPDRDTSGNWGPLAAPPKWRMEGIQPDTVTLPGLLRNAGYRTIHCGKAHWGAKGTPGEDPCALGFDVNIGGHAAGAPASYQSEDGFGHNLGPEKAGWAVPGLDEYHHSGTHLTDALTKKAKAALTEAAGMNKPFYLYMSHYAVHTPIQPHKRFMKNYEGRHYPETSEDIPVVEERYASMIEGMDASLGSLLDHLETLGVAEDTLVVFTSDNGGLSAVAREQTPYGMGLNAHNWPLHAGKGSAYEGGTRVPFIAAWARRNPASELQRQLPIKPGAVSDQPIVCDDLFPTLLGCADASDQIPPEYPLDGRDIRSYWTSTAQDADRPLCFHYPHVWGPQGPGYEPHSTLLVGEWKVIYFYIPKRWELYNIKTDIGETRDLAQKEPARLREMAKEMVQRLNDMGAQWPVRRDNGEEQPPVLP